MCRPPTTERINQAPSIHTVEHTDTVEDADPDLFTWTGPEDPRNPRNWPHRRKWTVTILVSAYAFMSPLSSSMIAPALPDISAEFGTTSAVRSNLMLSVFVLAFAVGPLILGPLSETYGRRPVIQASNAFFLVWTVACAVAHSYAQMAAFRFLAGLGGSAPLTTGGGTIADLFEPGQRGTAMAMYSLAPLLGPVVGPIIGGAVVQYLGNWRWIFGIACIASALPAILGFFFLHETYAPRILQSECERQRKRTGNQRLHTPYAAVDDAAWPLLRTSLSRPFLLLLTQPIVQVLALNMSLLYAYIYMLLTSFPEVFQGQYRENVFVASLNYISIGVGFTLGGQLGGRIIDRIYIRLQRENGGSGRPEMKLPLMMMTSLLVPIGLVLYGFSAQYRIFWLVPNVGAAIFATGAMATFLCLQTYIVDVYPLYAASALSTVGFCRSLLAFALPLAAPSLYGTLGYGYGSLVMAGIAAVAGVPASVLLYRFGGWLRARSKYAKETI